MPKVTDPSVGKDEECESLKDNSLVMTINNNIDGYKLIDNNVLYEYLSVCYHDRQKEYMDKIIIPPVVIKESNNCAYRSIKDENHEVEINWLISKLTNGVTINFLNGLIDSKQKNWE